MCVRVSRGWGLNDGTSAKGWLGALAANWISRKTWLPRGTAAVLHGENHDTATIRITERATGWLAVEKVDGISQRRRIPRRPVVDVDVVVPRRRDATRESLPPRILLEFSSTWKATASGRPVYERHRTLVSRVSVRGQVSLSGMIGWKMNVVALFFFFFFLEEMTASLWRINYLFYVSITYNIYIYICMKI